MRLSSLCINRPVLAMVLNIVIVITGAVALVNIGVRDYPAVDAPIITVSTSYGGASAEIIEDRITMPLEQSINGIDGIRTLTSTSSTGRSSISVEFVLGRDIEGAANDVRDRVSRAMRSLPDGADNPVVSKADANASPIIMATVASPSRTPFELSDIANDRILGQLQTIPDVSEVRIFGEKKLAFRLLLDPLRMTALGVVPSDIKTALDKENVELPAGSVEGSQVELAIRTQGGLSSIDEFRDLIIRSENGSVVRLSDVADVVQGAEDERGILKREGVPMVAVAIIPQPGANHVSIAREFKKRLVSIRRDLPKDVSIEIGWDTSISITRSINEVLETIGLAFLLVVLVIFAFLRTWRATLIPVLAMPITLIGTFAVLQASGFSINILTLLGIVLATGLVVDDAIVVLENIYQKIETGEKPINAGHKGAAEIFFAIIATTLSLTAVIVPILFMPGMTGRLFREFGAVMAAAALISAFVSLTLTPMMSSRILKHHTGDTRSFHARTEHIFTAMAANYRRLLTAFLVNPWRALPIMIAALILIGVTYAILPRELAPMEDRSRVTVNVSLPEGASFDYLAERLDAITNIVSEKTADVRDLIITMVRDGGSAQIRVMLKDPDKRKLSQDKIAQSLTRAIASVPGVRATVTQEQTIGDRRGGQPLQFILMAPSIDTLRRVIPLVLKEAANEKGLITPDVNLRFTRPQLDLTIDRERARRLGVSTADAANALQLALSGSRYGYFVKNGKQYAVIGQIARGERSSTADIGTIPLRTASGAIMPLDNIATTAESSAPPSLFHYNRMAAATVSAGLENGTTIGQGIDIIRGVADRTCGGAIATDLAGPARDFAESSSNMLFTFMFALLLVYLVLAAQFESFRHPIIVMFTVPLAIAGALLALFVFGQSLNVFSQIGIIMLVGLVAKNGILIVEFANQRRKTGLDIREAVVSAAQSRLRPILMTSLTVMLGTLPIALGLGASAQSRVSLGIAVIGGMLFSLVLSLFVVPAFYVVMNRSTGNADGKHQTADYPA